MLKITSIIAVVALLAFGFWLTAEAWVHSDIKFADWHVWIWPLVMLTVFSAAVSVAYAILPKNNQKLLLAVLSGAGYLIVFGVHYLDIIAFFLLLLFHVWAIRVIQLEARERLKVHPAMIVRRGIGAVMLPLFIALSFAYFSSPSIQERAKNVDLAPNLKQVVAEVMNRFLAGELEQIPPEQRDQISGYAIERVYDTAIGFVEPYRRYFPPILAFGLFLILWGMGFVLHRLGIGVGALLFLVLMKTRVIRIENQQVTAQTIQL